MDHNHTAAYNGIMLQQFVKFFPEELWRAWYDLTEIYFPDIIIQVLDFSSRSSPKWRPLSMYATVTMQAAAYPWNSEQFC